MVSCPGLPSMARGFEQSRAEQQEENSRFFCYVVVYMRLKDRTVVVRVSKPERQMMRCDAMRREASEKEGRGSRNSRMIGRAREASSMFNCKRGGSDHG